MQYKQVIVVRRDLDWTKGKIAAHSAHAAISAIRLADEKVIEGWISSGGKKIVVRVESLQELKDIYKKAKQKKLPVAMISDAGKTQLKKGTVTALGIGPAEEKTVDKITGKLKLL